jgi:NAD-dependent SIR2 family protein deacetylase
MRATEGGANLIIVNYQPTHMDALAAVVVHEDVAVILPRIAARVEKLRGIT